MNRERPEIDVPDFPSPDNLVIVDEILGEGNEAKIGHNISVHYLGVAYSSGEEFDSSWSRNQPLDFTLGVGQVIAGWDQGVVGMKIGGRRKLVIPPHLAYGDQGAGNAISPGETLIFVVDLLAVS